MKPSTKHLYDFSVGDQSPADQEYFFKQIIENLPGAFYACDSKGYIIYYTKTAALLWGKEPVIGKDQWCGSWKMYYPDGNRCLQEQSPMAVSLQTRAFAEGEERILERPNGDRRNVFIYPKPIYDLQGSLIGGFAMLMDRGMVQNHVNNEQFLRRLVASSRDCIKVLDLKGRLLSMNDGGQRLVEVSDFSPFIGTYYPDLWNGAEREAARQAIEVAKQGGVAKFTGYFPTLQTKTPKWWHVVLSPIPDKNGNVEKLMAVSRDITEQKELEENLSRKNAELQKMNNDLDNFIYTASHDLKSPVSNIEGLLNTLVDALNEESRNNADVKTVLTMIHHSIRKFKNTIVDLTEISKAQKSDEEETLEIDCAEIIENVKLSILDQILQSGADIEVDLSKCPPTNFSRKNFTSIVYNLLSNAIKYRDPDRPLKVKINSYRDGMYTVFEVADNGLGISSRNKEKLFTMFKRFHDHIEGTGIGLYIVKRIVDNAEGKIEVESELGAGTTFKVYLKNPEKHAKV